MGLIGYVLVGLVIGVLARLLMPGRDPIGIVGTILVGIVGAVIGSYLWAELFRDTEGVEWIGGVIVAMVLLYAYRRMTLGRGTV
ncbi:MAG: GlsB/YeaQ/YmgE family stress response membrane protein [Actinomycetota bacterium]